MDFTSWADWARALLGACFACTSLLLIWKVVANAASFSDAHARTGRHMIPVPGWLVRPRTEELRRELRACSALRRHQGIAPTVQPLSDLVAMDHSRRLLERGRRIWVVAVPFLLVLGCAVLWTWLASAAHPMGPLSPLPSPRKTLMTLLGHAGWYDADGGSCSSWSYLRGCESSTEPWWSGLESGFLFGASLAWLFCAWKIRRTGARDFKKWDSQYPPVLECLDALSSCRDALRPAAPEISRLDMKISALRAALADFSREGLPGDTDRRSEFEEHGARVSKALHETMGKVLRDGLGELPLLIQLLSTIQDRLHEARWLALLDPSTLTSTAGPVPAPPTSPPTTAAAADSGRGQKFVAIATALPAIPALLALAFTAVTVSQTADTLKLTQRDQIASDYNETVANLGDESVNVRTSAVFAIQRIMRDSPRDQPALVQILVTYIRDRAKFPSEKRAEQLRKDDKTRPAADVQAALDVLGARETSTGEGNPVIDLRNTFLVGASLGGSGFYDADLRGSDLTHADLRFGSFEKVWFDDARMSGSFLGEGNFKDATFINTDLNHAWWNGASFTGADMTGANLTSADYFDQESDQVLNLSFTEMSGANLTDANLSGAYVYGADFSEDPSQDIPAATLRRTDFTDAELSGARLDGTDRRTALWEGADLP